MNPKMVVVVVGSSLIRYTWIDFELDKRSSRFSQEFNPVTDTNTHT